ncbi:MAG: V-type ATP synthase subunit E family protein [Candidatus Hydrogenedentes bacterium]|jgi:vacuolar-type H+-ATPase subunit E/Vma4|nr:V-type ATP synthase subunit E family protein [Candidatus Hydrogenedentota bacterium]
MSATALLDTMSKQVAAECDQRRANANGDAEAILAEARAKSAAKRESLTTSTDAKMELLDLRWRQKAEAEAAKADLSMKNEAVKAIMAEVEAKVRAIVEGDGFTEILDSLLAEVMAVAEGEVVVLAPDKQVGHVSAWLGDNGHGGVAVEASAHVWDGVAIQDPGRSYRISNTLTGRYRRVAEVARKICMRSLFGASAEGTD